MENNLISVINELVSMITEDIDQINKDVSKEIYPDGQKLGLVTALKDLQTCLAMYDVKNEITCLDYDPDTLLTGRI